MLNSPFPPWPCFSKNEANLISDVLLSNRVNYWTGDQCRKFEDEFAEFAESERAISLANGSVAIEIALRALGIGAGDEVIVTPRSFIASVSSVVRVGARPVFADVNADTQALDPESIASAVTESTRAIIVVHMGGHPADMLGIGTIAKKYDLKIIEDCAQAHGARYCQNSIGKFSDIATWSFCQDKIMTTGGEGGMVTTDDEILWQYMWSQKDHGKNYSKVQEKRVKKNQFRWLHDSFGSNYRMTEIQAALGRYQLTQMEEWSSRRRSIAGRIWTTCSELPWLRVPELSKDSVHAAYKAYVFIVPEELPPSWSRDRIIDELVARGVPASSGGCSEIYMEHAFDNTGFRPMERLPVARELGETSLMFLVHPTLLDVHVDLTISGLLAIDDDIRAG